MSLFIRNEEGKFIPIPAIKGEDGVTPHIGNNGNWFIGETDTGKPSRGEDGVKTVNGITPDENGNVKITIPDSGQNGNDGYSPVATVEQTAEGAVITITDKSGTTTATVVNGKDGSDASVTATNIQTALGYTPANPSALSLGIHTDGLVYLFVSGQPVGSGIQLTAAGDVVGYVDENNNIVVKGGLADGTYSVKYEMTDGTTVDIGELVVDNSVYYSVTNNLTQCTNSNSATKVIGGQSYSTTITANSGYELKTVVVTMDGTDITSSAAIGGNISIEEVTGDIVITAVSEEIKAAYTNLADTTNADWASGSRISSSGALKNDTPGFVVTNYIPVTKGQTIHIKNAELLSGYNQGHYDSAKTVIANSASATLISQGQVVPADYDESVTLYKNIGQYGNSVSSYNSWVENLDSVRLTIKPTGAESDIIITVNENIV